jgi:iron complex outermembrane receptor protein
MRFLLLMLLSGIVLHSAGQSIEGKVIDQNTGRPVSGASVYTSTGYGAVTDTNGTYRITKLKQGLQTLTVSCIGYKTTVLTQESGSSPAIIRLEPWNLLMQPVEVRAIRAAENAPFAKTNLDKKDIEALNLGQDLPFLLNQTPSVVVNADAGNGIGYTGIRIRGTDATRINMTINGIPYNDAESQGIFFVNLPDLASSTSSIQVQRGVGTSSNGGGAFGATLNFSTNETNTSHYAEINNSAGSFGTFKNTLKAGTGLLNDRFTLDIRLSNIRSDGYIERASSDLKSMYVSAAYLTEKSSLRFNFLSGKEKTYQAWYGVSENDLLTNRRINYAGTEKSGTPYDNETDNYKQDHYQLFFNHAPSEKWTLQSALFLTRGKGYYEQYKAGQSFSKYGLDNYVTGNEIRTETDLIRQLWLDNIFYGQTFSAQYLSGAEQLTIGGGWSNYQGNHFGDIIWAREGIEKGYRWYDHDASKKDAHLYTKYQYRLAADHTLFGDLQYRQVSYRIDGFRDNPNVLLNERFHFINPKLGWSYTHNNYRAYFSYALGQKEPNRDDFEAGIQDRPRPEKLHDFEAGISQRSARAGWNAGIYYMYYIDQLVQTGKINDVGAYTRTNIPRSHRLGIELQAHSMLTEWWKLSGNATFSRNKVNAFTEYVDDYDNGGQKSYSYQKSDLAFSPNVIAQASMELRPFTSLTLQLASKFTGRQFMDNTSREDRSLDPFWVQDLRVQYVLHGKWYRECQFIVQVNNLLNTKYEPNGYTYSYMYNGQLNTENYYYPMAGTQWMAGINLRF